MERTDFEQWRAREVSRLLALVETERRYYQEMVAAVPVPLLVLSASWNVVWANRAFRQEFQFRSEDLRQKTIDQLLPIAGLLEWLEDAHQLDAHVQGVSPKTWPADVGGRPVRLTAIPIRTWDDEAEIETLLTVEPVPVDEHARSEEAARAIGEPVHQEHPSEQFVASDQPSLEHLLDPTSPTKSPDHAMAEPLAEIAAPVVEPEPAVPVELPPAVPEGTPAILWQADAATLHFSSVVGSVQEILGYPATHWLTRHEFFEERIHADDRAATLALYRSSIATRREAIAEFRVVAADGALVWCREIIRFSGTDDKLTGVLTLIARRKKFERQAVVAGRMDALHTLAGRLAHDLNNPLMIINGYGEEMLQTLAPNHPLRGDLSQILGAAQRIAKLAGKLTDFTRKDADPAIPVNVGELLAGLHPQIAEAAVDGGATYDLPGVKSAPPVQVDMIANPEPVWAMADPELLEVAILAIASANHPGAEERTRLTITCQAETITELAQLQSLAPGQYTRITLRDDGRGVEAAQQTSIFEPDLAPVGSLDLARAYTLIRQWGGDIAFSSEPLRGSSFCIYLQYANAPHVENPPIEPEPSHPTPAEPAVERVSEVAREVEPSAPAFTAVEDAGAEQAAVEPVIPEPEVHHRLTSEPIHEAPVADEPVALHIALETIADEVAVVPEVVAEPAPIESASHPRTVEPMVVDPIIATDPQALEDLAKMQAAAELAAAPVIEVTPHAEAAPVVEQPVVSQPAEHHETQSESNAEVMRETILVVDDEAGIRGLMRKILRRERYAVLEAASAEEALLVAAAAGRKINLLLTDVMLPGLQGPELARQMFEGDPQLKVLYISGYTEDEGTRAGDYPPGSRFLAKPFTLGALLGNVRDTLDAELG